MYDIGNSSNCTGLNDRWWAYIAIDTVLYLSLLSFFTITFAVYWLFAVKCNVCAKPSVSSTKVFTVAKRFRDLMRQLISGQSVFCKFFIAVTLLCNLIYLGLAIHHAIPSNQLEKCINILDPEIIVELVVVVELLLFSVVRFLACNNVLLFWLQPHTIVDVVTLSHVFIAVYFGVDWVGLRSLRFIWLTQIIEVVYFTPLARTRNAIDIIKLLVYFLVLWLMSSGILHLIEAQGDYWRDDAEPRSILVYVYLTMVTMSTVGYGDFFPITDLGRGFMILFILAGLSLFAAILPTLVDVVTDLYAKYRYAKFDTTRVPRHVIVCGHVTDKTASDFLKDFLHPDRGDTQTHVLFLHPERPDKDLKNVLRLYYTRVQFLLGSVLNGKDLKKAHICSATAIFILANKHTDNPTEEDHANLLRVVSVKNTTDRVPVIIQLLHNLGKIQVTNIEGWVDGRDTALCLNELKLGLLAQSCLCPGFSTLIANLFYTSDFPVCRSLIVAHKWREHYIKGASNEVYYSTFSEFFDGMTFHEAARICFNKLNLIMLGLEKIDDSNLSHRYYVNPMLSYHPNLKIDHHIMLGYFIAQDKAHVRDVSMYCECCLHNRHILSATEQFRLSRALSTKRREISLKKNSISHQASYSEICLVQLANEENAAMMLSLHSNATDGTGGTVMSNLNSSYYNVLMCSDDIPHPSLPNADMSSRVAVNCDPIEKWNVYTCNPVRLETVILNPDILACATSRSEPDIDIKDHIILCLFGDANSPLLGLYSFLKPLRNKHLPAESIKPVVITCEKDFIEKEWPCICDIPKVYVVVGSPLLWCNLRAARVSKCSVCVILTMLCTSSGHERAVDDKEAILCSLSIRKKLKQLKKDVLVITDLREESNVQFLNFGDKDTPDERIYKAQPFACGEAFSVSMFDSVTSSVFHGPGILYLVEGLLHLAGTKTLCQVISKPIDQTGFAGKTFGEFYNEQLKDCSICMGLSRKLTAVAHQSYVITSPDQSLVLKDTDVAFILM